MALGLSSKDISLKDDKPSEIFLFQLEHYPSKECYSSKWYYKWCNLRNGKHVHISLKGTNIISEKEMSQCPVVPRMGILVF